MREATWTALRHHQRVQRIVSVIVSAGAQEVLVRLGLAKLLNHRAPALGPLDGSSPRRVRLALESLGPTFIKLGQLLATRSDILSHEWVEELEQLHGQAQVLSWDVIRPQLENDVGCTVEQAFLAFDTQPIAAASIAQVYKATLHTGEDVIVKVQRPELAGLMKADLELLESAASLIEENPTIAQYQPRQMLRQLARAMLEELDFRREAEHAEALARRFKDDDTVVIPTIYWQYTGPRLLVQSFLPSIEPLTREALMAAHLSPPLLARRGAHAFMRMILQFGLFHADPHPGNLRAMADNKVGFIDFGMVGELSHSRRLQIIGFMRAIITGHTEALVSVMVDWSEASHLNLANIEHACEEIIARHGGRPIALSPMVNDFLRAVREYQLAVPPDMTLLFKALLTADGVLTRLDPSLDLVATARPILNECIKQQLHPENIKHLTVANSALLLSSLNELPSLLKLAANRAKYGKFEASILVPHIPLLNQTIERAATRVTQALVLSALILAFGPTVAKASPVWHGLPAIIWVAGVIGALWLLISRLRRGGTPKL